MTVASVRAAAESAQAARYASAPSDVTAAVRKASARTGVDFSYLMEKAAAESGYRTDEKASTSSATGLYQFIDSTWLSTVKAHGAEHGLSAYANAIQVRSDGRPCVPDKEMKEKILELRKDPEISAMMAAEFTKDNMEYMKKNTAGNIGSTELYMAHFLGASGGAKFINQMRDNPDAAAADLFPEAAATNKNVFYDKLGRAKSLSQIYDRFAAKFEDADGSAESVLTEKMRDGSLSDGFTTQVPSWSSKGGPANPLSIYEVLALTALETPDEADDLKARDDSDSRHRRVRDQPVRTEQTGDMPLGLGLAAA